MKRLWFPLVTLLTLFGCYNLDNPLDPRTPGYVAPLAVPTGLTLSPAIGQVVVTWDVSGEVTSYNLYHSASSGSSLVSMTRDTGATSGVAVSGTPGTPYYFRLTAVVGDRESSPSAELSATPLAGPPGTPDLSVTPEDTRVSLFWTPVSDATSYDLYWTTSDHSSSAITETQYWTKVAHVTSTAIVSNLINGVTYSFVVVAVNGIGQTQSAVVSATPAPPPSPSLHIVGAAGGAIDLGTLYPAVVVAPLTIENRGDGDLIISRIGTTGGRWQFALSTSGVWDTAYTPSPSLVVGPHATTTLYLEPSSTATPTWGLTVSDTLTITSNDANTSSVPITVKYLTGGTVPSVSVSAVVADPVPAGVSYSSAANPPSLDWQAAVSGTAPGVTFNVTNTGSVSLRNFNVTVTGSFRVQSTDGVPAFLIPTSGTPFSFTILPPLTPGTYQGTLFIKVSDSLTNAYLLNAVVQ